MLELRVALTTVDYDRLVKFYCDGLGLSPAQLWTNEHVRALILNVGRRVSGPICFALQVPDLDAAMACKLRCIKSKLLINYSFVIKKTASLIYSEAVF